MRSKLGWGDVAPSAEERRRDARTAYWVHWIDLVLPTSQSTVLHNSVSLRSNRAQSTGCTQNWITNKKPKTMEDTWEDTWQQQKMRR